MAGMQNKKAKTAEEYLADLPADRRETLSTVREVILKNLPPGYEETMNWGMICYEIPLSTYGTTYNGQPIGCAALASQKNYCSVYFTCMFTDSPQKKYLEAEFTKAGKKLNMGQCCVRFKTADDLPLPAIGKIIAGISVKEMIKIYEKWKPPKAAKKVAKKKAARPKSRRRG